MRVARLFKNGASQAVRLPADFRFDGDEVYVSRDPITGDVVLSALPASHTWAALFDVLREVDDAGDYMRTRPLNVVPAGRQVFEDS